ncbi:unnamed protein product [Adineta ricciae]|uniref:Uncharacterized protein n=1 Tax=Adineta ricciae TaxID=249248 RepID=A0A815HDD8_ADIRI|nr:unnamed protein product [Adineta ricciae]CAF1461928.1 unnamed protein product [Adineta ricciae]
MFVWVLGLTGTSLLVLGASSGLVFAPLLPLTIALFNQRSKTAPRLLPFVFLVVASSMIIFQKLAGLVMGWNFNHFSTLLVSCMLISICLYIVSNLAHFAYQRQLPILDSHGEHEMDRYSKN